MRLYALFLVIGLVFLFFSPALSFAASGDEDSDGDGLYDYEDNCPYEYGPYETYGCPDSDGDGIIDSEDSCPYEYGSSKNYGCPEEEPDYDGDGYPDAQDNCPEVYNKDQTDTDYDGLGDACDQCDDNDADGDGLVNCEDECPYEYGTSKNHGCPEQGEADSDQDGVIDSIDNCVLIYNPDQGDQDGDGEGNACDKCDDRDPDNDGIPNCDDECPNEYGEPANSGCPVQQPPTLTDIDGDGVLDSTDNCPKEYGTKKNYGCPESSATPTPSISLVNIDITRLLDLSGGNRGRVQVMISQPPPGAGIGLIQVFVDAIPRGSCIMTRNCTVNVPELHPGSQLGASVLLTNFTMINIGIIPIGFILNNSQTQDTDHDGIANAFDNCVNISNADQEDDDHDNVGDVCDSCNVRRATSRMAFFTIISCAGDPTIGFFQNGRYYWQDLYDRINTNTGCGCKDSDGTNYFFRGTTSVESVNTAPAAIDRVTGRAGYQATSSCAQVDQDTCLDTNRLAETICTASGPSRTTITCPAGCSNGVCTCTDTDGGLNYLTRGTLLGNTDSCSGNSLTEYYCGIDNAGRMISLNRTIECPLGCDAGACLCSETDSGVQFERRGTVGNRYTDTCLDRRTLREYSVSRNATQCNLMNLTWTCEGSCQNGTCLPPTCYDAVQNQGETGVDCGGPCSACGYFMMRGNLKYEKGNPYDNGNTQLIGYRPVRETLVFAIVQNDDDDLRSSYGGYALTDSQGYFTIIVPRRAGISYRLYMGASNMAANIGKDYDSCDEYVRFDSMRTFTVPAEGNIDMGNLTFYKERDVDFNSYWAEDGSLGCGDRGDINGGAQYFSIADTLLLAKQYVDANRDDTDALGRVNIAYPETHSSSGAAVHSSGEISIPGPNSFYFNADPGYRDKTILHEYGHNIEYRISTSDCYIGDSDHSFCSQNDEEFAWSEGFAEYFAQFMMNKYRFDPVHNLSMVGENGYGIENPTCPGGLNSMIEGAVQAVLWDLADVVGPTYPAANITEASFDRVANKDRVIMRILDKELDDCCDAPDICDFVRGSNGWKNRASEVGTTSDIDSILTQYGMTGVTGSSGGC